MLDILIIGLLALPLAGATLALIVAQIPRASHLQWMVYGAAAVLTFLIAWVLRPAQYETVFGNWSPVSFTGAPLILVTNPEGIAILIVIAALMALTAFTAGVDSTHLRTGLSAPAVVAGLAFSALAVAVLANNFITLVIGVGLVDLLSGLYGILSNRRPGRVLGDALLNGTSLAVIVIAIALYGATSNSLYLPLARTPERLAPFISIALALRFSLVPLRAASDLGHDGHWTRNASVAAGLVLLARLPQTEAPEIRAWFFVLAVLTAVITLALGALSNSQSTQRASVAAGALGMTLAAAATWQSGTMIVAAIGWLLGTALVNQDAAIYPRWARHIVQGTRLIGAACLVGLPLTAGFIGRSGIIATWAERGLGGAVLIVGLTVAQILLTVCALRLAWRSEAPGSSDAPRLPGILAIIVLVVLCVHVLLFGIDPGLAGAQALGAHLSRNGFLGWLSWLLAAALGAVAWWFEAHWLAWFGDRREWLVRVFSLQWLQDILSGALNRIARPFGGVFVFLESDGTLLWALIAILIVVLVSRPGGP